MAWTVEVSDFAEKQLCKMDKPIQKNLLNSLENRIEGCKNTSGRRPAYGVATLEIPGLFVKFKINS